MIHTFGFYVRIEQNDDGFTARDYATDGNRPLDDEYPIWDTEEQAIMCVLTKHDDRNVPIIAADGHELRRDRRLPILRSLGMLGAGR